MCFCFVLFVVFVFGGGLLSLCYRELQKCCISFICEITDLQDSFITETHSHSNKHTHTRTYPHTSHSSIPAWQRPSFSSAYPVFIGHGPIWVGYLLKDTHSLARTNWVVAGSPRAFTVISNTVDYYIGVDSHQTIELLRKSLEGSALSSPLRSI